MKLFEKVSFIFRWHPEQVAFMVILIGELEVWIILPWEISFNDSSGNP